MKDLAERRVDGECVYRGRLLVVHKDEVELPDGKRASREYIVHPGAVAVVPILDNGDVLLIRQFRYPVGQEFIEIPAGKLDPGEAVEACGERELIEETGYRPGSLVYLTTTHPCIGYADERIAIFLGRDLAYAGAALDDDEFVDAMAMPFGQAMDLLRQGRISDGKTMVGLFWAEKYLSGVWTP